MVKALRSGYIANIDCELSQGTGLTLEELDGFSFSGDRQITREDDLQSESVLGASPKSLCFPPQVEAARVFFLGWQDAGPCSWSFRPLEL